MEWEDEGIILHTQLLGERKQLVSLFTANHGRHAGVLARSKKTTPWVQCGGEVKARWTARLEGHLGQWGFDPLVSPSSFLLETVGPLAALVSAATLCHVALPERHAYPSLYVKFRTLLRELLSPQWVRSYIGFELALLEELGYGLNLSTCAVTGGSSNLVAVSPRTGRAVCAEVAAPYREKLLPLPAFLHKKEIEDELNAQESGAALSLTGHFLERHLLGRLLPPARVRLAKYVGKK